MIARMTVLFGADAGKSMELGEEASFLVIDERKNKPNAISLDKDAEPDARHAEVRKRGDFVHLRNLRPWSGISVNAEKSYDQGERAILRNGDVFVIREIVVRTTLIAEEGDDEGSGAFTAADTDATADESAVTSKIVQTKTSKDALAMTQVVKEEDPEKLRARLGFLHALTETALMCDRPLSLLTQFLDLLGEQFDGAQGSIMWRVGESESFRRAAKLRCEESDVRISRTVLAHVLDTKAGVLSQDSRADDRLKRSTSIRVRGMRSVLCVPILRGDPVRIAGVIHLDHSGFGTFGEADLEMVVASAATLASALDTMDRRSGESADFLRRRVGEMLRNAAAVPMPPEGVNAGGLHVHVGHLGEPVFGGTFVEAIPLDPGDGSGAAASPVLLALGEVGGEGAKTAIGAVKAAATVRALAPYGIVPSAFIEELGRGVRVLDLPEDEGHAIVARFDPKAGQLTCAKAGWPVVLHYASMPRLTNVSEVQAQSMALGAKPIAEVKPTSVALSAGDSVVLLTPGLIAALDESDPQLKSIRKLVTEKAGDGPVAVVNALLALARQRGEPGRSGSVVAIRRG